MEDLEFNEISLKTKFRARLKDWTVRHVTGVRAKFWLALFSFSEASFFIIPPDVLLVAVLAISAERWIYYSSFTVIFSVLGGLAGYFIGASFFDIFGQPLIDFYHLQEQMTVVATKFSESAFWTIFFSALTPIPYKVFTISAGFFKINLFVFLLASIFGRGFRFFAVGYFMRRFGKQTVNYFFKYFNIISLLLIILIILFFLFV